MHYLHYIFALYIHLKYQSVIDYYHTRPIVSRGGGYFHGSPFGDSSLIMNIHNPFMHCATSQYAFKPRDVIMLMRAVTIVAA